MARMKNYELVLMEKGKFIYRDLCMGVAMLWIVFFHSLFNVHGAAVLSEIKSWGYGGVDIFLFVSGMGCFMSLDRNTDINSFLSRRFFRTMPTYFLFITIYIIVYQFLAAAGIGTFFSARAILGNYLVVGYLSGAANQFNWYMSGMWVCYLAAPYLTFAIREKNSTKRMVVLFLLLILISLCWFNNTVLIVWARLPIFFMGICAGSYLKKHKSVSVKQIIVLLIAMVFGFAWLKISYLFFYDYLWSYGLHWYPFLLITPGLCILISLVGKALSNSGGGYCKSVELDREEFLPDLFGTRARL